MSTDLLGAQEATTRAREFGAMASKEGTSAVLSTLVDSQLNTSAATLKICRFQVSGRQKVVAGGGWAMRSQLRQQQITGSALTEYLPSVT